jgi:hypothetical protein
MTIMIAYITIIILKFIKLMVKTLYSKNLYSPIIPHIYVIIIV